MSVGLPQPRLARDRSGCFSENRDCRLRKRPASQLDGSVTLRFYGGMWSLVGRSAGVVCLILGEGSTAVAQVTPAAPVPAAPPTAAPPASTAAPAAASTASFPECFPSCRSGFTCHAGQCLSLCNPPCGAGERCLQNSECEREAAPPVVVAPQPTQPPAVLSAPSGGLVENPAKAANDILRQPGSWVFAARVGLQLAGGGHAEQRCTSSGFFSCSPTSTDDTDDKSLFMLGLDAMIHAAPGLRLGAGYQLVPYSALRSAPDDNDLHLGNEHALNAIVEGVLPVSSSVALALRAQAGLHMLVIGGDLADNGDAFLTNCHAENSVHCQVDQGPLFGAGYGAMLGLVGRGKVRWRFDLALDRFSMKLPSTQAVFTQMDSISRSDTLYGTRSWILGGVEL